MYVMYVFLTQRLDRLLIFFFEIDKCIIKNKTTKYKQ